MTAKRRVAVVGAGIAGLAAAHALRERADVTLYEADGRLGGHAHTVDVTLDGIRHGVDTGFLVYNERTYPGLIRLFAELGVATAASDMSFSVRVPGGNGLEWCGSDLNTVFAQRGNLAKPRFWGMLADILRFNRRCTALAAQDADAAMAEPLGDFLARERYGAAFRAHYLLPMLGCIWSCPTDQMLRFPVATMIRFCHNHGLLQVTGRPRWHTVRGGSRHYVERIVAGLADVRRATPVVGVRRLPPGSGDAGVQVRTHAHGVERYDDVLLAAHSRQSLALLDDASADEREVLGAIRTHPNRAVLHTDASVLPRRPRAWAAWNYEAAAEAGPEQAAVCLHYLINRLQPLPWRTPVIVSLNPRDGAIDPARVLGAWDYAHPVFDAAAIAAQRRLPAIQGRSRLWFCGAWTRYGFHEDGLQSGLAAAAGLQQRWASADAGAAREAA